MEREAEIIRQEQRLQTILKTVGGNMHQIQRRPQAQDGLHTWMEIHRDIANVVDFEQHMAQGITQTGLQNLLHGERHIEYFMDVSLCA